MEELLGNFAPPHPAPLAPPLSTLPHASFTCPAKVVGREWAEILTLHHGMGQGGV